MSVSVARERAPDTQEDFQRRGKDLSQSVTIGSASFVQGGFLLEENDRITVIRCTALSH